MISCHKQYSTLKPLLLALTFPAETDLVEADIDEVRLVIRQAWARRGAIVANRELLAGSEWTYTGGVLTVATNLLEDEVAVAGNFEVEIEVVTFYGSEVAPSLGRVLLSIEPALAAPGV